MPSKAEATALVVLTCGVMMAVSEGVASSSTAGVMLCIAGTLCNAVLICTSGKLLSEKLDVLLLTFYTAPVSCATLLPIFVLREVSGFYSFVCYYIVSKLSSDVVPALSIVACLHAFLHLEGAVNA